MENDSVVELRGTLLLTDMVRFQYFHSFRRSWLLAAIVVCLVVGLALAAIVPGTRQVIGPGVPCALLLLLWFAALTFAPYLNARKQYAALDRMRGPLALTYTMEGFSGTAPGTTWTNAWGNLKFLRETKSLFLLYQLPNYALIVPKRFFESPVQMETWRRMASRGIAPKGIDKSGLVARWC